MSFMDYLIDRVFSVVCLVVAGLLIFSLLWLIETPMIFICFTEAIIFAFFATSFLWDYWRRSRYYNRLLKLLDRLEEKTLVAEISVAPHFLDGQILSEIIKSSNKY